MENKSDTPFERFKNRKQAEIKTEYESYLQRCRDQNKEPMSEEDYAKFLYDIALEQM